MAICPTCQHANPDEAETCERCSYPIACAASAAASAAPPTVVSVHRGAPADGSLSAPLPPRMVEPIQTPTAASNECEPPPSHPALTESLDRLAARNPASPTQFDHAGPLGSPAPVTVRTNNGTVTAGATPTAGVAVPTPLPVPMDSPSPIPTLRLKLVVLRGQRVAAEYPIYEGRNTIGRFVDKPVDIDLVTQEPLEQVWCSRLHAAITFDHGVALVEDLNSLNGTWVNGARIHPGQLRQIRPNDVIQIGTVQMKLVAG